MILLAVLLIGILFLRNKSTQGALAFTGMFISPHLPLSKETYDHQAETHGAMPLPDRSPLFPGMSITHCMNDPWLPLKTRR